FTSFVRLYYFNDTPTTEIYTLSLHDALPIYISSRSVLQKWISKYTGEIELKPTRKGRGLSPMNKGRKTTFEERIEIAQYTIANKDRKSTRLNSSHVKISYAVFCLKKKIKHNF